MTLDQFIKVTHKEVDQFKTWYLAQHEKAKKEKNGEDWPLCCQSEGDWYEQFIAWQQSELGKGD